jgi:PAB1-binding protein PBP1
MSQSQTQVVERNRAQGIAFGTISNLSNKAQNIINVRQFTIYSKAGRPV